METRFVLRFSWDANLCKFDNVLGRQDRGFLLKPASGICGPHMAE